MTDTADLRRRIYDAARTPAILVWRACGMWPSNRKATR